MKLKLMYNGNPAETRIINADTGESIPNVVSVHVDLDAFGCNALIEVRGIDIDINNAEGILMHDGR